MIDSIGGHLCVTKSRSKIALPKNKLDLFVKVNRSNRMRIIKLGSGMISLIFMYKIKNCYNKRNSIIKRDWSPTDAIN